MHLTMDEFQAVVEAELDRLPAAITHGLDNVVFLVEAHPDDGADLFGMYLGVPATERAEYGFGELPDQIVLFRDAHQNACATQAELGAEVRATLIHEIAHYRGIDDDRLHELGWS